MSAQNIKIAMCQLNPTTGDFEGNYEKAVSALASVNADIYVFPECYVSNYMARDFFLNEAFIQEAARWVDKFAALSGETGKTIVFGAPYGGRTNSIRTYNMLLIARGGQIVWTHSKRNRPNYDVFDDKRYFEQGVGAQGDFYEWIDGDRRFNIVTGICEEIWQKAPLAQGDIALVINSSPYAIGKATRRRKIVMERVFETRMPMVYVNQVGGNDDLVVDGGSSAVDFDGRIYEMAPFVEGVEVVEFSRDDEGALKLVATKEPMTPYLNAEKYIAACMGLRDWYYKNGVWKSVVLGLSGGKDSGIVALMVSDVLGEDLLRAITMPSQHTADISNTYAFRLAAGAGQGIRTHTLPIGGVFDRFLAELDAVFGQEAPGLSDENLQPQIRGDYLSFYSNRYRSMIVSTGNKSEVAMGYATLYGDMRGAFNPIGDLYATEVIELMEMRHRYAVDGDPVFERMFFEAFGRKPVPLTEDAALALFETLNRAPSAELRPDQKDTDSLPDYPILDSIIKAMVDNRESWTNERIAEETGHSHETVAFVRARLRQNEFKRDQSCPKPKIHMKSFSKLDWRYPLVNKFVEK
jgi:NAD+ synthetase